jgi:predicted PolB exonuclease-like 3'-5' exonuclease
MASNTPEKPTVPAAYFIDIETVPGYESGDLVPGDVMDLYIKKFQKTIEGAMLDSEGDPDAATIEFALRARQHYDSNAGLYAEFGKIVSISLGKIVFQDDKYVLRMKNFCGDDELKLLKEFREVILKAKPDLLCAHNGKEFDFPYLYRRMMINKMVIPHILNCTGKKTWEYPFHDTMEIWSGSQWKYKCSLDMLCHLFGVESPKQEISGKDVARVFYNKEMLPWERYKLIGDYNNADVVANAKVYLRLMQFEFDIQEITYA